MTASHGPHIETMPDALLLFQWRIQIYDREKRCQREGHLAKGSGRDRHLPDQTDVTPCLAIKEKQKSPRAMNEACLSLHRQTKPEDGAETGKLKQTTRTGSWKFLYRPLIPCHVQL